MSTTYILHGGFSRRQSKENESFYQECVRRAGENARILLCFFAAETERVDELFEEMTEKFRQAGAVGTCVLATQETFSKELEVAQLVYFHGGHTPTLLLLLRQHNVTRASFVGKVVAGSSAGAYALATHSAAHSESSVRDGLGCVPVRLVCHFGSKELPPNTESLSKLQAMHIDIPIVYLNDCAYQVFDDSA